MTYQYTPSCAKLRLALAARKYEPAIGAVTVKSRRRGAFLSRQRREGETARSEPFLFASVARYGAEPNPPFAAHYARS